MGLDMYLHRHTYVKNWDWNEDKYDVAVLKNGQPATDIDTDSVVSIVEEVCYWRKANYIHNWFVENVQDGIDDCGEHYVSNEKISDLFRLLGHIIEYPDEAESLLSPVDGFFFGSQEIDDYYWDDIKKTHQKLKDLLSSEYSGRLFYSSSW